MIEIFLYEKYKNRKWMREKAFFGQKESKTTPSTMKIFQMGTLNSGLNEIVVAAHETKHAIVLRNCNVKRIGELLMHM